ncbi:MAG: DNA repair protein RecN, partial [Victivallaceae bacterium]
MLQYLKIDNLALIGHTEVEFAAGFNVITGETGAGKSILLGAVSLLLGERADRTVIRTGADRCEIGALFRLEERTVRELAPVLAEQDIPMEESGELQLRRVLTEGGGRCYVNGVLVPVRILKEIGELLIDVHGANEHQSLTSRARQLELLDRYAGAELLRGECAAICGQLLDLRAEMEAFNRDLPNSAEAGYLGMLVSEIEKVDPKLGEDEELTRRHALAADSRRILTETAALTELLTEGENAVTEQLSQAYRMMLSLAKLDEGRGNDFLTRCELAQETLRELADDLNTFAGSVELDEAEFAELENRLSALHTLKRRYGPSLGQVLESLESARGRLADFERADGRRREFAARETALQAKLREKAGELGALRRAKAAEFAEAVAGKLAAIGFAAGRLEVEFEETEPGPLGMDQVEILFSANEGEVLQPLRKIASSGELSRLMLALKTV